MNINDLTDEELIELKEDWDNDQYEDSYGIARAVPEWCFADNPERMFDRNPHWVIVNRPEWAFEHDPLTTTKSYERWVEKNKPEYFKGYMANKRAMGYCWDNGMQLLND
jgi:hypothetical protein